ncbi:MAG: hypothetical protein LBL34_06140 [Clostridiales bacterium]|jgi:hypothetical protein|nr:hypothetical protein [Clostridiales bacterium]
MNDEFRRDAEFLEEIKKRPNEKKSSAEGRAEARANKKKRRAEARAKEIAEGGVIGEQIERDSDRIRIIKLMMANKCRDVFIVDLLGISSDELNEYKKKIKDERPSVRIRGNSQIRGVEDMPRRDIFGDL